MAINDDARNERWVNAWLDKVVHGKATMSQRAMTAIATRGGIETVVRLASVKGVHLVQLTDDRDRELVVASLHPFKSL